MKGKNMSKKITLLVAGALAAFAFAALPAIASADPALDPAGGKFPVSVTEAGGVAKLTTTSLTVTCQTSTGSGSLESSGTGSITFTFHTCTGPLGASCTSAGQPSGTIHTSLFSWHLKYKKGTKKPVSLITANAGHFATFACAGITTEVLGNGIIGEVTSPECGKASTTSTVSYKSTSAGNQEIKEVEGEATVWDLKSKTSGGSEVTAAEDGSGTLTFGESVTLTCP
jgi:hypothetical protein